MWQEMFPNAAQTGRRRTGAQAPSQGELSRNLSCDFHWYSQLSPETLAGRAV